MQSSAIFLASPPLPLFKLKPPTPLPLPLMSIPRFHKTNIKACSAVVPDSSTVDYSSGTSVFPAEACEIVGGEACEAQMYPEVRLQSEANSSDKSNTTSEPFDREYLEYDSPKTVFLEEACDDLGGEFCQPEFLKDFTS